MKKVIFMALLGALTMVACKTPNIAISKQLEENTSVYDVKGRQGWQFNQVINYGEYTTSKIKRGWSLGYDFPFAVRFQKAKEKLSYKQHTPFGTSADVLCIGQFKNTEIPILGNFFGISLDYEDYFAGSVKNSFLNWDFVVYNPDNNNVFKQNEKAKTSGEIINSDNKEERIIIKPVHKVEGQFYPKGTEGFNLYGFEFFENGKSIGAVSLVNNGRVWINNDISKDKKLVLSSVMTGLMVRHSMSEGFND